MEAVQMHYIYKREAKVKIAHALEKNGWKLFGYHEDQSDSMTDYFHPASWDGIATKNGHTLVIDNSNTCYSGYEVKKYNYSARNAVVNNNNKIEKLRALANDEGATEGEKAAAREGIERLAGKEANDEPTWTVIDTYPTFTHGNPGKCSWHIEKDGQILAKGTGVFACNEYDWEDKTKTAEEQKREKVADIVARFEKVLKDSDALQAEVIIVPKISIKPVEKNDKTINKGDVLSFSYHGHYWIVLDVYTVGEQVRVTYELLGSEKRGYKRVNNSKRYYQPLVRLQKEMDEGKVKVHTLQEVTEYEEKTIFKKTGRKQPQANFDIDTLPGDVEEETTEETVQEIAQAKKETVKRETVSDKDQATKKQLWALHCATKLNTTNLVINKAKASELISKSKAGTDITNEVKALLGIVDAPDVKDESITVKTQENQQNDEDTADCILDYATSIIMDDNTDTIKKLETEEEKAEFKNKIIEYVKYKEFSVSEPLINHFTSLGSGVNILLIVEALQSLSTPNNSTNEILLPKIEKQIESSQKKLEALSGDYLTNTWKRQNEESSRENKRDQLRFDITFLEYLKEKTIDNSLTVLEQALITGSIREAIRNYHIQKYKYNHDIKYPVVDRDFPIDGWYNIEVPKRQKRLNKANIYNTSDLTSAVEEYDKIVKQIEKPINPIEKKIKKLEMEVKLKRIDGYFPTPKPIVQRMIELADIRDGDNILEPSAGNGNILDGITDYMSNSNITASIQAIEWNMSLSEILKLKHYDVIGENFLEHHRFDYYDKIVMNPPFEKAQDIQHVQHAYKCLKNGGRIVAIMSPHFTFANDSKSVHFREWLDGRGYYEKLPEGSFKESGTNVNTILVVIDKIEEEAAAAI